MLRRRRNTSQCEPTTFSTTMDCFRCQSLSGMSLEWFLPGCSLLTDPRPTKFPACPRVGVVVDNAVVSTAPFNFHIQEACTKSGNGAPKARNMKARGKREAKRSASPLGRENNLVQR